MEKKGKVFSSTIPPKLYEIWKYLAMTNVNAFTIGEKNGRTYTSSLFQQQRGDWYIHWMGVNGGKKWDSVLAAIPPKPDQILKYLARINFKALTTENKRHKDPTHLLSP